MVLVLCQRRSERRRAPPAPTHEKAREANERSTRGSEKEEAEEDPDTEQRHPQPCLHGTHADSFWADSGHLAPLPYAPLSWYLARLATWLGGLITPPFLLGVNGTEIPGHYQHEDRAQPHDVAHYRFHCHPPVIVRKRSTAWGTHSTDNSHVDHVVRPRHIATR